MLYTLLYKIIFIFISSFVLMDYVNYAYAYINWFNVYEY